jgi:hypothetical protein
MLGAGRGPVTRDHGEHPPVAVKHVHRHRRHASRLRLGEQRPHERRAQAPALPGVGHHHADIRPPVALDLLGPPGLLKSLRAPGLLGFGPVRRHRVADDDTVPDGDHGGDVTRGAGQDAEQGRAGRDRAEESQLASLYGQSREEVAERGEVCRAYRPDRGGYPAAGPVNLGSVHEPSIVPDC